MLQSTGPSHRVGSNVQNVIAKLKTHNPALCAAATERQRPRSAPPRPRRSAKPRLIVSCTDNSESEGELQDMMDQLAEEYTHMSTYVLYISYWCYCYPYLVLLLPLLGVTVTLARCCYIYLVLLLHLLGVTFSPTWSYCNLWLVLM